MFRDQYRAPEVLNELRRRDWAWVQDLDDAVVITLNDAGQARGHFSVDLSKCGACGWARFWSSLLDRTLFVPRTAGLVEAANGLCLSSQGMSHARSDDSCESKEAKWWSDSLRDSANFQRDVAGLMVSMDQQSFFSYEQKTLLWCSSNCAIMATLLSIRLSALNRTTDARHACRVWRTRPPVLNKLSLGCSGAVQTIRRKLH